MKLYDTLTEKKISLDRIKRNGKPLRLFVCGPTVYDDAHIGHACAYIVYDMLVKYLRARGYPVFYLQNITDIDDKIIVRAAEQRISSHRLARRYERSYRRDMRRLSVDAVNIYARATAYIQEIQGQIKRLLSAGYAYYTDGGIYFSVRMFSGYGALSKQDIDALSSASRIDSDPHKRDPLDFVVWKFKKNKDEPSWKSPWTSPEHPDGRGRPGWHIEDTAIAEKYFGLSYDLHGGGMDLKFPHHEAELALAGSLLRSPGFFDKAKESRRRAPMPFVRLWIHSGLLTTTEGEKMSKSIGNIVRIKDFLVQHSSATLRLFVLMHHYRSSVQYTDEIVRQAERTLASLLEHTAKLSFGRKFRQDNSTRREMEEGISGYRKKFHAALEDDFNTPKALGVLFTYVRNAEKHMWEYSVADAESARRFISDSFALFGVSLHISKPSIPVRFVSALREVFRQRKYFSSADLLRRLIEAEGYAVEDTPAGPFLRRKTSLE